MNYLNIEHCSQVNGSGNRVVLWVAGCSHHCRNCQNQFSWDPCAGVEFDEKAKEELFADLTEEWCSGVTFSGGDPMYEGNRSTVIELAKEIKLKFPNKNIWLYSGYTYNEIINDESMRDILKYIDVLCDGEYVEELRDIDRHWVGSSNQEVIDVKKRLSQVVSILN